MSTKTTPKPKRKSNTNSIYIDVSEETNSTKTINNIYLILYKAIHCKEVHAKQYKIEFIYI